MLFAGNFDDNADADDDGIGMKLSRGGDERAGFFYFFVFLILSSFLSLSFFEDLSSGR